MKIFTLIIAILAILPSPLKSPEMGVFAVDQFKGNNVIWNMESNLQKGEMGECFSSQCIESAFGQSADINCIKHCIQKVIAGTTFFQAFIKTFVYDAGLVTAFLAFVFFSLFLSSYAIIRYLLYVYTIFHLRFVKTIVLRD